MAILMAMTAQAELGLLDDPYFHVACHVLSIRGLQATVTFAHPYACFVSSACQLLRIRDHSNELDKFNSQI
jgi:hypothetical protein